MLICRARHGSMRWPTTRGFVRVATNPAGADATWGGRGRRSLSHRAMACSSQMSPAPQATRHASGADMTRGATRVGGQPASACARDHRAAGEARGAHAAGTDPSTRRRATWRRSWRPRSGVPRQPRPLRPVRGHAHPPRARRAAAAGPSGAQAAATPHGPRLAPADSAPATRTGRRASPRRGARGRRQPDTSCEEKASPRCSLITRMAPPLHFRPSHGRGAHGPA